LALYKSFTYLLTDKPTNKLQLKHNLLGIGKNSDNKHWTDNKYIIFSMTILNTYAPQQGKINKWIDSKAHIVFTTCTTSNQSNKLI